MASPLKLLGTARGPFLLLAPACALPGLALADRTLQESDWFSFMLILIACITGHISVNVFNEVDDCLTGLDERTTRTPCSGGSGTLQKHPELLGSARVFAWAALGVTVLIGAWFVWLKGPVVVLIGVLGVVAVLFYSRFVRSPFLCLFAPGVGFGTVMTLGAFAARTGTISPTAALASLIPLLMVSNLLLLNQFPDLEADRSVGRRHIPIVWGLKRAAWLYTGLHAAAYLAVAAGLLLGWFPVWTVLAFVTLPLAAISALIAIRHYDDRTRFFPALSLNVQVNLLTPVIMAVGFWLG